MTMLADRKERDVMTIHDYEARIYLYKEQIGTGYIGIGRTLNEAKAAGVVPHGEWESWVTRVTGLEPRQAQRCMKAATEIRDGSALARLEMSKALMILSSGLDEDTREEVAEKAAEEGATVKALRKEIDRIRGEKDAEIARINGARETESREAAAIMKELKLQIVKSSGTAAEIREALKKAQEEREQLEEQLKATHEAMKARIEEARGNAYRKGIQDKAAEIEADVRKEFQNKIDFLNTKSRELEEKLAAARDACDRSEKENSQRWDEGYRAGVDQGDGQRAEIRQQADREVQNMREALEASEKELAETVKKLRALERNQGDLLDAAEEAEKRAADAEAELAHLKADKPQAEPAWEKIPKAIRALLDECETLPLTSTPEIIRGRAHIETPLRSLEIWMDAMKEALAESIPGEGVIQ